MKVLLIAIALLAVSTVVPAPAAAVPPVCIVKDIEAPHAEAEVWLTCGMQATATVCAKDGFCRTVSAGLP